MNKESFIEQLESIKACLESTVEMLEEDLGFTTEKNKAWNEGRQFAATLVRKDIEIVEGKIELYEQL